MEAKNEYAALAELRNLINGAMDSIAIGNGGFNEANYKLIIARLQTLKDSNYPPVADQTESRDYLQVEERNGIKLRSPRSYNKPYERLQNVSGDQFDLTVQVSLKKYRYPGDNHATYNRDESKRLAMEVKEWLEQRLINQVV